MLAKYYSPEQFPTTASQKKFEKSLFTKTHKANAEIIMLDGLTCLYKSRCSSSSLFSSSISSSLSPSLSSSSVDLFFYVLGSGQENELVLMSVLDCLFNSVTQILRKNVDKKALFDNLEVAFLLLRLICFLPVSLVPESLVTRALSQVVMLAIDEMVDGGMIMESDPAQVPTCSTAHLTT